MADRTERGVLNTLIVTCRDADRGFTAAAELVKDRALSELLLDLARERRHFADALVPHAQRLGGDDASDGTRLASMHRLWIAVRDRLAHQDHAVVAEAERGERAALAAYDDSLAGMLPPDAREIVEQQRSAIAAGLQRLHALGIAAA